MKNAIAFLNILLFCGIATISAQEKELYFTPNEVESMLFLYNQAPVKGDQVEMVAPIGGKLRQAAIMARTQKDSTQSVKMLFTPVELQICYNVLSISTFEARYAELVLGMKKKLEKLLPPPEPQAMPTPTVKK